MAGHARPTQAQLTQKAIEALGPLLTRFAQTMALGAPLEDALNVTESWAKAEDLL